MKKQLIIDYYSKRRMAGVALGIVKGIVRYFDERDSVDIMQLTPMDAERVQIKVEFLAENGFQAALNIASQTKNFKIYLNT